MYVLTSIKTTGTKKSAWELLRKRITRQNPENKKRDVVFNVHQLFNNVKSCYSMPIKPLSSQDAWECDDTSRL